MPSLTVALGRPSSCSTRPKQFARERDLGRSVHLGLDDVDRALARVDDAAGTVLLQVVQRDRGGDDRVHDALGDLVAGVAPQDRRVGHQVADVAHEQQRAAVQGDGLAAGAGVDAVGVEATREGLAALADLFGQGRLEDAEPVAVGQHLVGGVDHRDRVFQVEDGRKRRFQHQVGDSGRVGRADLGRPVDAQVQVQAVVLQQDRRRGLGAALVAAELDRLGQAAGAAVGERDDERPRRPRGSRSSRRASPASAARCGPARGAHRRSPLAPRAGL